MRYFIITVDTEGDNLWQYKNGDNISTMNANFIPRFQHLCEKYGFYPVYLTNYEMAKCPRFIDEAKEWLKNGHCEIGVHLHAWNNPPTYELKGTFNGNPYLIEYPEDVMRAKFNEIYNLLVKNFDIIPVSHRAGRWAMDERYFSILNEFGIKIDCSYTPGIKWNNANGKTVANGSDYSKVPCSAHFVNGVLEIPATVRTYSHYLSSGKIKHQVRTLIKGGAIWLRPALSQLQEMKKLMRDVSKEPDNDYLEFMIHSSELMPGGSPYFPSEEAIDRMYDTMESVFSFARFLGYTGATLKDYARVHLQNS